MNCTEIHPTTGAACAREAEHVNSPDPQVRQHVADNGVKWPTLHELDPAEGYNVAVPYRQ